ncbi:VOC family protein [Bradyrhizobium japonicum]|uniref:VOC family protein n=1 Tax=Bradyrhizobium japonicum TaxID=375 RepID=UPI001E2F0D4C|nr:VOC family protein [Bradyrhizobium japonicum]MCD9104535.1 VOC family protein [Bradyrhizobium japonicum]MCD9260377.1 VOC family protein [Bradyrhizobium japonicum SEMIA 5079]MCD9819857.1 VOC family protein [Bradyrhizobium japonicum]MCD9895372.1 VOC family protein [Bradyrhizobium japonicum]MCD9909432.1 VOC family protein [Bradyrhizobium japonicum]
MKSWRGSWSWVSWKPNRFHPEILNTASPMPDGRRLSGIVFSIETPVDGRPAVPGNGVHVAFQAPDRETVRRFHQTAMAQGGTDEGASSIRENYNANYYGAFVRDPDGIRSRR